MSPTNTANDALASQLAATIQAFENSITACPPKVWGENIGPHEFWYLAYHSIFWLDCYSSESVEGYTPPAPFTMAEMDPAGLYPDRVYTKDELLTFLARARATALGAVAAMDGEGAAARWKFGRYDFSVFEKFLLITRHLQHHTGQLQLLLRQGGAEPPRWVRQWPNS